MHLLDQDLLIMDRMTKVIQEVLKPENIQLTNEMRFVEDLGADSLDKVSLLMTLEQEFNTQISDTEAAGLVSVGSAFNFIKAKMAGAQQ
jgi:acyl carrier protein